VWQEIPGGQDEIDLGRRKIASRAYCALFNFRGADRQKRSASSQVVSATVSTSRKC
jgi:hypothetical protein